MTANLHDANRRTTVALVSTFLIVVLTCQAYGDVGVQAWARRYSNKVGAQDLAQKVVADHDGNVIVAGSSDNGISGGVFLVIKYSGAGIALWTNRYLGPGSGPDQATALAVDGNNNVLVSGQSRGAGGDYDYAVVAYSAEGIPLWTNCYNGTGNGDDRVSAAAVDSNGSVFVTGYSVGSGGHYDYATVAYSAAGVPLWTNRYHGPASSDDQAADVAVDSSGKVFVTGQSGGTNAPTYKYEYATVAYSGAGLPLWTNRYHGPGSFDDKAVALAVDGSGNVFVTGSSSGIISSYDYATIKYSGAGAPLWTNRYDGPDSNDDRAAALAVDNSGNVCVTGYSSENNGLFDYATVAYSGAGLLLWSKGYHGPGVGSDQATAVAVDGSGNVFVTGFSVGGGGNYDYATLAYSSGGAPLWTNRFDGPGGLDDVPNAVAVDGSGNVFVTGRSIGIGGSFDFATAAYSPTGAPLWTNYYDGGPGNADDVPAAMAVDINGNVVVTGYSIGFGTSRYYATVEYSSAGVPLWTNLSVAFNANAVAVDSSGNVFVTGTARGSTISRDYATLKYSSAGVPIWTNRYKGPAGASAVAVDSGGNVIVTGTSADTSLIPGYATIKYSGAGVPLWTNRYHGPGDGGDLATAEVVDGSGNVFVTGYSDPGGYSWDYATIKYSGAGAPLWTNRYNGPGNGYDLALAMALDKSGNIFVTGYSAGSGSGYDYATLAYSSTGVALWTNRYNGPGNGDDKAAGVAVDGSGKVFVTGSSLGTGGQNDYATLAYSGAGVPLWTNRYHGPGNTNDYSKAIAVDDGGNVFVTGFSARSSNYPYNYDCVTIKYSGAGIPMWTNRYNGPANGDDQPQTRACIAIGRDGAVFVAAASDGDYSGGTTYDFATIKYVPGPILAIESDSIGGFFIHVTTIPNAAVRLQRASGITDTWSDIVTNTAPASGEFEYHETSPLSGQGFYRAVQP